MSTAPLPSHLSSPRFINQSRFLATSIVKITDLNHTNHQSSFNQIKPTSESSNPKCLDHQLSELNIMRKGETTDSSNSLASNQPNPLTDHSSQSPSMLNQILPTRFQPNPPSDLRLDSQDHTHPSSAYAPENPLVIRNFIRHFSPPFKPFGTREIETNPDPIASSIHPSSLPSALPTATSSVPSHPEQLEHAVTSNKLQQQQSSSSSSISPSSSTSATSSHRVPHQTMSSNHVSASPSRADGKARALDLPGTSEVKIKQGTNGRTPRPKKTFIIESDEDVAVVSQSPRKWKQPDSSDDEPTPKQGPRKKTKAQNSQTPQPRHQPNAKVITLPSPGPEASSKDHRTNRKISNPEKRRKPPKDSEGPSFRGTISDTKITPRSPRPERHRISRHPDSMMMENGTQLQDINGDDQLDSHEGPPIPSTSNGVTSPQLHHLTGEPTSIEPITISRVQTIPQTSDDHPDLSPSKLDRPQSLPHPIQTEHVHEQSEGEPPKKKSRPKRPKPPVISTGSSPNQLDLDSPATGSSSKAAYRIPSIIPACEPDAFGQYESSTCHQCRIKTTRPKMICDQSQDPNCVVRVCVTCLMTREVYDDHPELRPPIFEFVPGGKMLCVKCRNLCPCASCRRRRGEKEQCRRGLGGGTKGFYGMTQEEREQALVKKKERQEAARLRKESRPPTEKKTPVICRREAASIRLSGFDDDIEQERLQNWAPLPVFPPLPPPRKKKRKRLENLDPSRVDCKTGNSESDSSCSDSDTNDDTDSDTMSISSDSSQNFHHRNNQTLGSAAFNLSLTSQSQRNLSSLSQRWCSNGSLPESKDRPEHVYRALKRKSKRKAPTVWIKGGTIVQARKPPTQEFLEKLAFEQRGNNRSSRASTVIDDEPTSNLTGYPSRDLDPLEVTNGIAIGHLGIDDTYPSLPSLSVPFRPLDIADVGQTSTNEDMIARSPLALSGDPSKSNWLASPPRGDHTYRSLSLHGSNTIPRPHALPDPSTLNTQGNPFSQPSPTKGSHDPSRGPSVGCSTHPPVQSSSRYPTDPNPVHRSNGSGDSESSSSVTKGLHSFESDVTPLDHQTYLSSLTDEQLKDVITQGNYYIPTSLSESQKYSDRGHQYSSTGISPELISASLPNSIHPSEEHDHHRVVESEMMMNEDLTEEDQQIRLIEAANWAAVWGATDGLGGFTLRNGNGNERTDGTNEDLRPSTTNTTTSSLSSPSWDEDVGGGKELFLKAMRSSVGDEWLTDVMPLDGNYSI